MTKFKILSDTDKAWDKTLAHFTDLFSLRKAYGDDKASNSGFKSAAHIRDHSSAQSVIIFNMESDFTCYLFIESLEEPLAAACEYCAMDTAAHTRVPPSINHLTIQQTKLAEQCKQQKLCTKLMDTTELISTRHDCLSFALRYNKSPSLKLWIFHKRKGSIALELLGFS